ncbi:MAG: DUF7689 domain-containing protein [Terriglobia bacterium]
MLDEIYRLFPRLRSSEHRKVSEQDRSYNCFAWAAGISNLRWEPDPEFDWFWPSGVPREYTLDALVSAFQTLGYRPSSSDSLEDGHEKVALYELNGEPAHAARQLSTGAWTSKIGRLEDIEHALSDLEGDNYGRVFQIMKRPRS